MRYLEKPTHTCPICGKSRRWADHTECSKQLQAQNKKTTTSKKKMTRNSEAYFAELLKRIGE